MGMKGSSHSVSSIRLGALVWALAVGCAAAGKSWSVGNPWSRASADGLVLATGSFTAWGFYHVVSRNRNGLITGLVPCIIFLNEVEKHRAVSFTRVFLFSASFGLFIGFSVWATERFFRRREKLAPIDHLLANAKLDAPPTG